MADNTSPISGQTGRLIVFLLALIAVGLAVLIVVLLTGGDSTEVTTPSGPTASVPEDTSPATGTILDDIKPDDDTTPDSDLEPERMTLGEVVDEVDRMWPNSSSAALWGADMVTGWTCVAETDGDLVSGSVATCRPDPPIEEGQHPVLTVLILDGAGKVAVAEAGVQNPTLSPDWVSSNVDSGLNCTRLTEIEGPANIDDPLDYFGTVLYWFLEGRPSPLMDIDENGIPCETKYNTDVVTSLWSGAWLPPAPPPLPGESVDRPRVSRGDVLEVFGVAYDDTLNVRLGPGTDQPVLTRLAPATEVEVTGQARSLSGSTWYEVIAGTHSGWVNADYVGYVDGRPVEFAGRSLLQFDLEEETKAKVGLLLAEQLVTSGRPAADIVISVAPFEDEITLDLITKDAFADGSRLLLIFAPRDDPDDPPEVLRAELTRVRSTRPEQ